MNSCGNPQTGAFFVWVTATEEIKRFASLSHPYMRRLVGVPHSSAGGPRLRKGEARRSPTSADRGRASGESSCRLWSY
jgi:hypothetical protein